MSLIDSQMPHIRQEHAPNYFETHAAAADQIAVTPGSTPQGNSAAVCRRNSRRVPVHAEEPIPGLCPPEATDSDCATDLATFSQYVATGFCRVLGFQRLQRREPEHLRAFFHGRLHGCKV